MHHWICFLLFLSLSLLITSNHQFLAFSGWTGRCLEMPSITPQTRFRGKRTLGAEVSQKLRKKDGIYFFAFSEMAHQSSQPLLWVFVYFPARLFQQSTQNMDRRPPTLLKQFTIQQLLPSTLPKLPSYLYLFPNQDPTVVTLAVSSPLITFNLSPPSFFGAQSDGLCLSAMTIERAPEEESDIVQFVRTPEGRGVGVMRANGGGETWRAVGRGSRLVRSDRWKSADHVVVLEGGKVF
jgi:hypothetical protein